MNQRDMVSTFMELVVQLQRETTTRHMKLNTDSGISMRETGSRRMYNKGTWLRVLDQKGFPEEVIL